jgi:hypothetical protein
LPGRGPVLTAGEETWRIWKLGNLGSLQIFDGIPHQTPVMTRIQYASPKKMNYRLVRHPDAYSSRATFE